jgi:hypothetical protein
VERAAPNIRRQNIECQAEVPAFGHLQMTYSIEIIGSS